MRHAQLGRPTRPLSSGSWLGRSHALPGVEMRSRRAVQAASMAPSASLTRRPVWRLPRPQSASYRGACVAPQQGIRPHPRSQQTSWRVLQQTASATGALLRSGRRLPGNHCCTGSHP
eukprot:7380255-Prymnesium_polylepis.4